MKFTKGHLKKFVPFLTALAIVFTVALARAGEVPEVYHAEEHGTRDTAAGPVKIDSAVTTIAPSEIGEVAHLVPVAEQAIQDANTTSGGDPLFLVEQNGQVKQVDKQNFLTIIRKLTAADFKAHPYALPILSITAGAINGIAFGALLFHEGYPRDAALIGGLTGFTESFSFMFINAAVTTWFNKTKQYPVQFGKGMAMTEFYLTLIRLAMWAAGHPLDPTFIGSIIHNTSDSFVQVVTQEPTNILVGQISEEKLDAGADFGRVSLLRTGGYSLISAFVAVMTAMHMSPNPHVRMSAQLLNSIVAVPATIYLGYKQNWIKSLRAGWDHAAVALSLGPQAVAEEFYFVALRLFGKIEKENPGTIPDSVSSAAEEQLENSKRAVCDGGMNLI